MKTYCETCDQMCEYEIIEKIEKSVVKGELFQSLNKIPICNTCQNEIFDWDIEGENQTKVFNMYREKHDLIYPDEIKAIRKHHGLSQREFSIMLGFGEKLIARFERGSLPSKEQSDMIRHFKAS